MNRHVLLLSLAVLLCLLLGFTVARARPTGNIIVNGADSILDTSVTDSQELVNSAAGVEARIITQYANSIRPYSLLNVPDALQTLFEGVPDRILIQYANSNREVRMDYPVELIDDNNPPEVTEVSASPAGGDTATITWTTDEFADSTVLYGTQPGVYPYTVSDPLYVKEHGVTLTDLIPGTLYYYKVRSTDRSGNTYESPEHSFEAKSQLFLYLPSVLR